MIENNSLHDHNLTDLLVGGTLRQHLDYAHSSQLLILGDCTVIWISHFQNIQHYPAISDQLLVQMLRLGVLMKLHCIQAGDKLHQRLVSPTSGHKWFPMYHCKTLQHD